ncbi:MAG: methyltransferase domain-containing protein, partial [Ignavibacteriaceae bacterium]|nr:methyltransferase domain-containing protein [Ignavibacteriaceae bacterium]
MPKYANDFWNERYSSSEYVYGENPNRFFKEHLEKIGAPGKLFLPGEGEGRNAVYAAKLGWKVDAYDQSTTGKLKATKLADKNNVMINYHIEDLLEFTPPKDDYDAIAIIYVHLNTKLRKSFNEKIIEALKPGGKIILELFSKEQLGKSSGGPQDLNMLYSVDEIKKDFGCLKAVILKEEIIN